MLPNAKRYHIWRQRLSQLIPESCKYQRYRLANMVLLVVGIYKSRSVHLSLLARQVPIRGRKLSLERRLRRFMDNGAIRVREWYRPIAVTLLKAASSSGQVHLLIDSNSNCVSTQLRKGVRLLDPNISPEYVW